MQDPFYPITNPQAAQNMYSQRTMAHIANKFDAEIRKMTETMLETASKTKLGSEVVQQHRKERGAQKLTSNERGDVALMSLNQNLVELDRLSAMKKN